MTVRLLAIDVDGTLVNSKGHVSDYTRRVLHEAVERDIYVVISTGRSRAFLQCVSEQVGLDQPMICNNGAEIWKSCDELLKQRFMPLRVGQEIVHILHRYGVEHMWGNCIDGDFTPEIFSEPLKNPPLKIGAFFDDDHQLDIVRSEIAKLPGITITSSDELNIEMMQAGTSKASGLVLLAQELGISLDEVICFGDSYNDLEMFKVCGTAVAMGNANDEVKRLATYVTATNDDDGVARAIEKYVFNAQMI